MIQNPFYNIYQIIFDTVEGLNKELAFWVGDPSRFLDRNASSQGLDIVSSQCILCLGFGARKIVNADEDDEDDNKYLKVPSILPAML